MSDSAPPARVRTVLVALLSLGLIAGPVPAQVPGEIGGVVFDGPDQLLWNTEPASDRYHVYRGPLDGVATGLPPRCHGFAVENTGFVTGAVPTPGAGYVYLVTGESDADGEGTPGAGSDGAPRALLGSCPAVMRNHVLNRAGYGWNEWARDRIETLGLGEYVLEQLDPLSIDEGSNTDLSDRLDPINPPTDIYQLIQQQVVRGVYARRQLEWQVTAFWANHFNTFWQKLADIFQGVYPQCQAPGDPPQCDPDYPAKAWEVATELQYREMQSFRRKAFSGNFREIVEASSLSLAMIVYLDTYLSVVGAPNENFPRELLELYAMGVNGGYTQQDVEELSRALTGWSGCKKTLANLNDPLAPCIQQYWLDTPAGKWVATFNPGNHDCTQKVLFAGTPQETIIPDTCGDPASGVNNLDLALDAIVAHPATPDFISRKILERFVTETPEPALVNELIAEWNNASNPQGVGDLKAVLTAALTSDAFLDPDRTGSKVKSPLEHLVSAIRVTRGRTDGLTGALDFLILAGEIPHYNPVPTGWPESGGAWIGTNNTLERQNFPVTLLSSGAPEFGADPIQLLNDNGISTLPGNAEAIVDFLSDAFFGAALTPAERQAAIDYLNTDGAGNPAPYDDVRILETVVLLLGYPHFQEQ
jgi:uncharacterized protein (DUF1800 family)